MPGSVAALPREDGRREYEDFFGLGRRPVQDLDGLELDGDRVRGFLEALRAVSPAAICVEEPPGGRNGGYAHAGNRICVSPRLSPAMMIRAALHETVHAILHPWPEGVRPPEELPHALRETEAEGAAFLVCLHYGLDVSGYSTDYIRGWNRHLTPEESERCMVRSWETAERLVTAIDAELNRRGGA